ncbi:GDP-L-fucose synthase family protein [Candidatus Pelagibacter sp.]|jgi:GDP-L-fucose synthase|uniref:GDP-L-fucose synthase family protein n=1 Tax=Candidatus Pelagibacter sp. TaxID=2024849 RepID=UPI003F871F5A
MKKEKIFIAGHKGMVGSSVLRIFKKRNYNITTLDKKKINLLDQSKVYKFLKEKKFDSVIICAARAGGIFANNKYRTNFIYENLQIQNNLIYGSHLNNVKKLIFLGSSCIYPKVTKQPMAEEDLLSGYLEPTNEPYAIAKIAGIKLCESINIQFNRDYRCLMPTNLYGVNDNFDLKNSHVIPALIRKFHEAKIKNKKKTLVWGTGKVYRDFLYVDDLADAIFKIYKLPKNQYKKLIKNVSHVNVGSGKQISIKDIATKIKDVVGFKGKIEFDKNKPDGMKLKMLSNRRIFKTGWRPKFSLKLGLNLAYNHYKTLTK